jgi:hypothetical protein
VAVQQHPVGWAPGGFDILELGQVGGVCRTDSRCAKQCNTEQLSQRAGITG